MMKKTLLAAAMLAGSTATLAEISGNVSLTTDYAFRGVSQTDEQIAIQGGFDYEHESGIYAGTWASNVNSTFLGNAVDPQIELDVYAGYSTELTNGVGIDVGILQYFYPGGDFGAGANPDDANTTEFYFGASSGEFSAQLNYSNELAFVASTESAWYISAGYETTLMNDIGLAISLGHSFGDAYDVSTVPTAGIAGLNDSYTDWSIGVSKNVAGVDLALTYVGSDGDDLSYTSSGGTGIAFGDLADDRIVFSISKSL